MNARHLAAVVSLAIMSAACTSDSDGASESTLPTPTPAPLPTLDDTPDTSQTTDDTPTTTATTTPDTTTTTVAGPNVIDPDEPFLPLELGPRVDSVPGVDSPGEIIELLDDVYLFIPTEEDPDDFNVQVPLPEDRDILTAYAEAQAAYHSQASTPPVNGVANAELSAALFDGGARFSEVILAPLDAQDQHLSLESTILLRPIVIADPRSEEEAFIFDCQLDGTVVVDDDSETLAEGQVPGIKEFPQIASIRNESGGWIADRFSRDERACI